MRSVENLPILAADLFRHECRVAAEMTEITAIYNTHGSEQDAKETVSLIEPDSLVYIEGFGADIHSLQQPNELAVSSYEGLVQSLGAYRRVHGKNDRYEELKNEILKELDAIEPANNLYDGTFMEHKKASLKALLEKDCIVVIADYDHFMDDDEHEQSVIDAATRRMVNAANRDRFDVYNEITENGDVVKHFLDLERVAHDKHYLHNTREKFALLEISSDLRAATQERRVFEELPRTPEGKIKAYLCYGTAHLRSLTPRLKDAGITVNHIEARSLAEPEYFDETVGSFKANANRRVAMETYLGLMQNLYGVDFDSNPDLLVDMYDALETVNTNREEMVDFCLNCIKIYQQSLNDNDGVENELEQLHRRYIDPSAGAWVGGLNL